MEWKTKRSDGTSYEVRVTHFSKEFKFQFKEKGAETWDHQRRPGLEDLQDFVDAVARRYQRRQATHEELQRAQRMLADFQRSHSPDR